MAKNRKCISCGEQYYYCPTCSRSSALQPSWKSEFCSETCMTLWMTLTKYGMEHLTKDEAKEIVSNLNLKPITVYADCVQQDYAKVMADEKIPKRGKRAEMKIIDESMDVEPEVFESTEKSHEVVIKKENE